MPLFHRFHEFDQYLVHGIKANQPPARVLNIENEIQDTGGDKGQQDAVQMPRVLGSARPVACQHGTGESDHIHYKKDMQGCVRPYGNRPSRHDVNHLIERGQQQHPCGLIFRPFAGRYGLGPYLLLKRAGSGEFVRHRRCIGEFFIQRSPGRGVLPEYLPQRRLRGCGQQIQPELGCSNRVGLLNNQLATCIET